MTLARRTFVGLRRWRRLRLRLHAAGRRRVRRRRGAFTARVLVTAVLPSGRRLSAVRRIRVVR